MLSARGQSVAYQGTIGECIMQSENGATLIAHVDTNQVTREQLALIPTPEGTDTFKTVPHIELVDSIEAVLEHKGIQVKREQFAVRSDGTRLFGTLDLTLEGISGTCGALGFRTGNDRTMKLQMITGARVFVCDNMAFSGDSIILNRKHTAKLDLLSEIYQAVGKFVLRYTLLRDEMASLSNIILTDADAKAFIYDAFQAEIMPGKYMYQVGEAYLRPPYPEFQGRNAWSLHNAFTYVAKDMFLNRRMEAIQKLGRLFNLLGNQPTDEPIDSIGE